MIWIKHRGVQFSPSESRGGHYSVARERECELFSRLLFSGRWVKEERGGKANMVLLTLEDDLAAAYWQLFYKQSPRISASFSRSSCA